MVNLGASYSRLSVKVGLPTRSVLPVPRTRPRVKVVLPPPRSLTSSSVSPPRRLRPSDSASCSVFSELVEEVSQVMTVLIYPISYRDDDDCGKHIWMNRRRGRRFRTRRRTR